MLQCTLLPSWHTCIHTVLYPTAQEEMRRPWGELGHGLESYLWKVLLAVERRDPPVTQRHRYPHFNMGRRAKKFTTRQCVSVEHSDSSQGISSGWRSEWGAGGILR